MAGGGFGWQLVPGLILQIWEVLSLSRPGQYHREPLTDPFLN